MQHDLASPPHCAGAESRPLHYRSSPQHRALTLLALSRGYRGVRDLAQRAGVSPRAVYYMVRRGHGPRTVERLAAALGVPRALLCAVLGGEL